MEIRRVGFFCDHTSGVGGGEHYAASLLRALTARGPVDLLVRDDRFAPAAAVFRDKLGARLDHPNLSVRVLESPHDLRRYDLFFNLSHFTVLPPWARRNVLVVFFPELQSEWVEKYDAVLTISNFSASWVANYWNVAHVAVARPPVDAMKFRPGAKEPLILSVGRFFDVPDGNAKNQLLMIRAFRDLLRQGATGWRLALAGSTSTDHAGFLARVRAEAAGLPVDVLTDVSFDELRALYARASIYWHAAGFHRDGLTVVPSAAEHFGIVVVEALASGAVPVVPNVGGPAEIVEEPSHGLRAGTVEEFVAKTAWLMAHPGDRDAMSARGVLEARTYSHGAFAASVHRLVDAIAARDPLARGRYFSDAGNFVQAEREFLEAIDLHPASGLAHFELADCAFRRGHRELALAMWRRGAEIDPAHPRAARARRLADRIDTQRRSLAAIRSGEVFGEDYFERGRETGLNDYTDYSGDSFAGVQAELVAGTFAPSSCLEIGCAKGEFVRELRRRGVDAWGTDISAYSVAAADPLTRRRLSASMISALPYADDAFDLVTAVEVFEHVPPDQVDTAIRELWRVARTFVWITVQNTTAATPEHFFTDLTHVTMKPLSWWQDRFRANGFEVLPFELPFGQFRLHQIVAQPLGKYAQLTREELLTRGRALLAQGQHAQLVNFLDLLEQQNRALPELRVELQRVA